MSDETIRQYLDQSRSSWYMLTLTDGISLPFKIGISSSENAFSRPGYLMSDIWPGQMVFIPLNRIAGLSTFNFKQETIETPAIDDEAGNVNESAAEVLRDFLLENANAMGFLIEHNMVLYRHHRMETKIEFTDVTFSDGTALYSDWGYMQRISGGLNSIGVGGISAGWSKSLWALFKKKIRTRTTALEEICSKQEAVISGFVTFIDENTNSDGKYPKEKSGLEMEGANWVPAAISSQKPDSPDDLIKIGWQLIYFRDDGVMFPLKSWDFISQPVHIFGEIIPVKAKTTMGDQACYLKARASAFVK